MFEKRFIKWGMSKQAVSMSKKQQAVRVGI